MAILLLTSFRFSTSFKICTTSGNTCVLSPCLRLRPASSPSPACSPGPCSSARSAAGSAPPPAAPRGSRGASRPERCCSSPLGSISAPIPTQIHAPRHREGRFWRALRGLIAAAAAAAARLGRFSASLLQRVVARLEILLRLLDTLLVLLGSALFQLLQSQILREKNPNKPTESFSSEESKFRIENWFWPGR